VRIDAVFQADGIEILRAPPGATRTNAICERLVGTLRRELLDRMLILNETHLRRVLNEYVIHYNGHRPHWALKQRCPNQGPDGDPPIARHCDHRVHRRPILNGLINEYHQAA
jgi:transposase InsO family protein